MRQDPVIAIDGPAGVGKSTVAKGLAKKLGFALIDTGALYRAVAWVAHRAGIDWEDGPGLGEIVGSHSFAFDTEGALVLDGELVGDSIRTPLMSRGASAVAHHREVRDALLTVQRNLGANGRVVLEGRDIGTVVFPDAEVKFFLTASSRVRARRRYLELRERGEDVALSQVEQEQVQRDEADMNRPVSPLRKADDADQISCDDMTASEVINLMNERINLRFPLTSNNKA